MCGVCHKSLRPATRGSLSGSLSGWLFRGFTCSCKEEEPTDAEPAEVHDSAAKLFRKNPGPYELPDLGSSYEVMSLLGEGGMGRVYKVKDFALDRIVAVKVLRKDLVADQQAVKRFEQEAIAATALTHPNLVTVYGHGKAKDGSPYIIMDYLNGHSLADYLKRDGPFEIEKSIEIFLEVCDALIHAHERGVIHRDLKPSNIILAKNALGEEAVQVVDFGIAKLQSDIRVTASLTETDDILGSPAYMSPEQCIGTQLDARSDVYSLGCVMYEMLTGNPPFLGSNPVQLIIRHLNETPLPPDVSSRLSHIIMRCLRKEPTLRYQNVEELKLALEGSKTSSRKKMTMRHFYNLAVDIGLPQIPMLAISCFFSDLLMDATVQQYPVGLSELYFFLICGAVTFGMYWASILAARLRSIKGLVRRDLLNEYNCATQTGLFLLMLSVTPLLSAHDLRVLAVDSQHYSGLALFVFFVGWIFGPTMMYVSKRNVDTRIKKSIELSGPDRAFKMLDHLLPIMPED